jgi:hypothetical protein
MKTLTKSVAFLFIILMTVSCAKEEIVLPVEDELSDQSALKGAAMFVEDLVLEGETHFPSYATMEEKVISPYDENFLTCNAILSIKGHKMILKTKESLMGAFDMREVDFSGQISSNGEVKFSWPTKWVEHAWDFGTWPPVYIGKVEKKIQEMDEQIKLHTGCEILGPGKGQGIFRPLYTGTFDGENFEAYSEFTGMQVDYGVVNFYTQPYLEGIGIDGLIAGPVRFTFSIELSVPEE